MTAEMSDLNKAQKEPLTRNLSWPVAGDHAAIYLSGSLEGIRL